MQLPQHSYEEVRDGVISVLLKPQGPDYPSQYLSLVAAVGMYFHAREPRSEGRGITVFSPTEQLHPVDAENVRDVF